MPYADKVLHCQQCGNTFIFTVEQQRQMVTAGQEVIEPVLCPACQQPATPARPAPGSGGPMTRREQREQPRPVARPSPVGPPPPGDREAQAPTGQGPVGSPRPAPGSGESLTRREHQPGRHTGRVKWFDARKGFGFIVQDDGSEIFVHHTGIAGEGYKRLEDGQPVEYEIETTGKGPQAINVTPIELQ
jgi:CspA family cold shock protein